MQGPINVKLKKNEKPNESQPGETPTHGVFSIQCPINWS
jgi:hypothetical protein